MPTILFVIHVGFFVLVRGFGVTRIMRVFLVIPVTLSSSKWWFAARDLEHRRVAVMTAVIMKNKSALLLSKYRPLRESRNYIICVYEEIHKDRKTDRQRKRKTERKIPEYVT